MGRTRSSAADIAEPLAGIDDFAGMACSMFKDMKRAETWKPLSEVLGRIAAKLADQRNKREATPQDAASRLPAVEGVLTGGDSNAAGGVIGAGLARPNLTREASASRVRSAMHGGVGKKSGHV